MTRNPPDGFKRWESRGLTIESTLPTRFDGNGKALHRVVMLNYDLFDVTVGATTDSVAPGDVRFGAGDTWRIAPVVLDGSGPGGGISSLEFNEQARLAGAIPPGGVSFVDMSAERHHLSGQIELRARIIQHRVIG